MLRRPRGSVPRPAATTTAQGRLFPDAAPTHATLALGPRRCGASKLHCPPCPTPPSPARRAQEGDGNLTDPHPGKLSGEKDWSCLKGQGCRDPGCLWGLPEQMPRPEVQTWGQPHGPDSHLLTPSLLVLLPPGPGPHPARRTHPPRKPKSRVDCEKAPVPPSDRHPPTDTTAAVGSGPRTPGSGLTDCGPADALANLLPQLPRGVRAFLLPGTLGLRKDMASALRVHFSSNMFTQIELNSESAQLCSHRYHH